MILGALDIAPRSTGHCAGSGERLPSVGAWAYPALGDDVGELLFCFDADLCRWLDTGIEAVVLEAPILVVNHGPSQRERERGQWAKHLQAFDASPEITPGRTDKLFDIRRNLALFGHVEWRCRERGIECAEVDLRKIKKELAGFSSAGKPEMVAAAEKIGLPLPASPKRAREDAADAFGAWLLLLRHKNRSLSARFDSALWGRRGALL